MDPHAVAAAARDAAALLADSPLQARNAALRAMAEGLDRRREEIVRANQEDMRAAEEKGVEANMIKRLAFDEARINSRIASLRKIEALPDPLGRVLQDERKPIEGLKVRRVAVPLGVILMIYEARPHVTVNAGAFCVKAGNAAVLRGGSEAARCNALMGELWGEALEAAGLPRTGVQVVSGSHEDVAALLEETENIDLVIPRGGKRLIETVAAKSRIPVVKHYAGVCHLYVDDPCDLDLAVEVAIDSKCLMPAVCNAMETTLVAAGCAERAVPRLVEAFRAHGVAVKGCPETRRLAEDVEPACDADWTAEYLDLVVSMRVVQDVDQAVRHVNRYGSHHTDAVVTSDESHAERFRRAVDSGVVLVNASTMFCDGESLGMGAEIGISTDKIHARGPMGLEELTSYKFIVEGEGRHVMGTG